MAYSIDNLPLIFYMKFKQWIFVAITIKIRQSFTTFK